MTGIIPAFTIPPQMTGKEPMLKPTAPYICKGYSSRSLQVKPLLSIFMISVFVEELLGFPVDTKIRGTEKKKKIMRKGYIIHKSMLEWGIWIRILALDQHSMKEYLPKHTASSDTSFIQIYMDTLPGVPRVSKNQIFFTN